jgi:hypothetical protein
MHFGKANQRRLVASLGAPQTARDFQELMFGARDSQTDGLADRLIAFTTRAERDLGRQLNELGLIVDVYG